MRQILEKVKEGAKNACEDMLFFTDQPSVRVNAEYLFTVNVAKSISRLNFSSGDPYSIYIERKTKIFSEDCIPPVKFGHPSKRGSTIFRNSVVPVERNGRIDVSIYEDQKNTGYIGKKPICAIEVKGFNPSRKKVLEDLKRNLGYFELSGATGPSVIDFAVFVSAHFFKKTDAAGANKREEKVKRRYAEILSEVGVDRSVEFDLSLFPISHLAEGRVVDEGEENVLYAEDRHHYIGVLIVFNRKII